ncbi:DUF4229 domain-containing protein [Amnibacterium sp. CER49]|uniref:DUF4229 domain-containing protein n=1 Tax=Amnibacterium sp. CER49 TaxID=3039161 RepID=UPI0024497CB8|nr:DUF4229 domain-containing protein [Amnibacterium sp. CER49]MDH2443409.1 DUF4229 domain-containing protein [Amnibacterium sp. CER49]
MSGTEERRSRLPGWLVYSVLRVLSFAVPFLVAWGLGVDPLLAVALGAVIGLAVSVLFLSRQRRAFTSELQALGSRRERRRPSAGSDESVEDGLADGPDGGQSASAAANPKP